jgi:hypothetical protein
LKTNDGQAIHVKSKPATYDFQDLIGRNKGLEVDLTKANFPGGVDIIDVVEIEARVSTQRQAKLIFNDGSKPCQLATPKILNFYTKAAPAQMIKDVFLVRVEFSALDDIQLDLLKQGQQEVEECNCFGKIFGGGRSCETRPVGRIRYFKTLKCELANRRQPIHEIVRKVDEA